MTTYALTLSGGSALGFALFASDANRVMRCDALTPVYLTTMVSAGVLLWLLLRNADVYRTTRTVLLVMAALALLIFWVLPVSPPRFALPGVIDIVAEHDPIAGAASRAVSNGQNHLSAFPSLHVGWSALCAYAAWSAIHPKHPRLALLAWLFPLVMVGVVITTGNHYVLDVAGSVALLAVSIAVAAAWDRYRQRRASIGSASPQDRRRRTASKTM